MVRHDLSAPTARSLAALLEVLDADPSAPTTVRTPARAVDVHLADSLVALELAVVRQAASTLDLGSGAGFPGLALAAALPNTSFCLVDSVAKKCAFIRRAAARAAIANARVVHARAEALGAERRDAALVTARAVGSLELVAEYAAPLLAVDGHLVAWKGRRDPGEELAAARAAEELGLEAVEVVAVSPYPGARHHHLHVYRKASPTPDRFPRRPGIARKRTRGFAHVAADTAASDTVSPTSDRDRR